VPKAILETFEILKIWLPVSVQLVAFTVWRRGKEFWQHEIVKFGFTADLTGTGNRSEAGPVLSLFPTLIVHSELKSVHPGFPVAFIF